MGWCLFPRPFRLTRRDLPLFAGIGLIAALHFVAYVASLSFTTIAHALAIVYTAPVFVALFSAWFLKEPVRERQWIGTLIAVDGGITRRNIGELAGRGVDVVVTGSAVFDGDVKANIEEMTRALRGGGHVGPQGPTST